MAVRFNDEIDEQAQGSQENQQQNTNQFENILNRKRENDKNRAKDWIQRQLKDKSNARDRLTQNVGKKAVKEGAKKATKSAAKTATKQATKQGIKRAIEAAGSETVIIPILVEVLTNDRLRKIILWSILGFILVFIMFFTAKDSGTSIDTLLQTGQTDQTGTGTGTGGIPGLTNFQKTGPSHVENGQTIEYTISANYAGNGTVTVSDTIPTNTEFVSATGDCTGCSPGTAAVSWKLAKGANSFTLVVKPTTSDIVVINNAVASGGGGNLGGGVCPDTQIINANSLSPASCQYLNAAIDIFDTSFTDAQKQAYIQAYQPISGRSVSDFTQKVDRIVSQAQKAGFNPVIPLGYWKTESNFGSSFGCPALPNDFETQLNCVLGGDPDVPLDPNRTSLGGGAAGSQCARAKNPQDYACRLLSDIRTSNSRIYASIPLKIPIQTFDDFAEAHGSRAPDLEVYNCIMKGGGNDCTNLVNNNCVATYNSLLKVANTTNSCKAGSLPVNGGSGLAACSFVRGDNSEPYASPKLLGYFEEVSRNTGVPAAVLASIVKVESTTGTYNISQYSDDDISQMDNTNQIVGDIDRTIPGTQKAYCPRSGTGALGIMQIQPGPKVLGGISSSNPRGSYSPNPNAYCESCVSNGLQMARKAGYTSVASTNDLSMQNYCDPRLSLYIGSGFILEKLRQNGVGDGTTWNPAWNNDQNVIKKLVTAYYGTDSQTPLYVNSMISSLNSCQGTGTAPTPTPLPGTADLRQQLIDTYGITFNGFDQQHLQWAQRKLNEVSKTKFPGLVKGAVIQAINAPDETSEQVACPGDGPVSIKFHQNQVSQDVFDITLIHELSHLIQHCSGDRAFESDFEHANNTERGVTYYAQNTGIDPQCPRSIAPNEDYADMIAYYLNPGAQTKNVCKNGRQPNPYTNGGFPLHFAVARKVIGNFP